MYGGGIRGNIATGKITYLQPKREISREIRECAYCFHEFEAKRWQKTRFCSISCSKKGQNNRLGEKHTEESKKKMAETRKNMEIKLETEIVPVGRVRNRVKKPHFVKDPYQWANSTYSRYRKHEKMPSKTSDDYALYKYGEWLLMNQMYSLK